MKEKDLFFTHLRAQALAHPEPCGYCNAKTGELCVNKKTGTPLVSVPAHYARLKVLPLTSPSSTGSGPR